MFHLLLAAMRGVFGWAVCIFLTVVFGFWIGQAMRGFLLAPQQLFTTLIFVPFYVVRVPVVGLAMLLTAIAWISPLWSESIRWHLVAAAVSLLTWIGIGWVLIPVWG